MKVSNSQIQTFKRCRRLWELQYKHELKPVTIAPALETGSAYHDKLESILKTGTFESDSDIKTNAMAEAFKRHILPKIKGTFEPEVSFEYQTAGGNTVVGRYDGISANSLIEHKSTSGAINGSYWTAVDMDEQVLTYMLTSGKRKVVYTVCQKPKLKQSKNETLEQFQERCTRWYDVDTESKIAMQEIIHTDAEVEQHAKNIDLMCEEIGNCKNFYRNTAFCMYYGRLCEFAPICRNYDPGKTYVGFERK